MNTVNRIEVLDSLRGIAAVIVVLHHCLYAVPDLPRWIAFTPLRLLDAGGQGAVLIFFTLSGFVLFEARKARSDTKYSSFLWRRFARIYPPFFLSIIFSALLYWSIEPKSLTFASNWFNDAIWTSPATFSHIGLHLLLLDTPQDLNNVMWSLAHELRISAVFPLIALATLWNWKITIGLTLAFSSTAAAIWWQLPHTNPIDLLSTARYIFVFAAGAALSQNSIALKAATASASRPAKLAAWTFSAMLITYPERHFGGLPTSIAAIALVALCYSDKSARRILGGSQFIWLGRVSYSLYLFHLPIIAATLYAFGPHIGLWPSLVVGCVLSLVCAAAAYELVERPSISLGRFGADFLDKRKSAD